MDIATQRRPILLIDRENFLGGKLAELLMAPTVVLVTKKEIVSEKDVIIVPYVAPIPKIPEGMYSRIVLVWSEKEAHLIEPLAQKAAEQRAEFFIIAGHDDYEKAEEVSATLLVLGDLFDARQEFPLTEFLQKAKNTKKITLSNMGLHVWRPILFSDALTHVAEILHQTSFSHRKFFIGPEHAYTSLSIAHSLQKIDPDIRIDFSSEKTGEQEEAVIPRQGLEQYDPMSALQKTYKNLSAKWEHKEMKTVMFPTKEKKLTQKRNWGFYSLYVLLVVVFLPAVFAFACMAIGFFLLTGGLNDLKSANISLSLQKIRAAEVNFSLSQNSLYVVEKEAQLVGQGRAIEQLSQKVSTGKTAAQIIENGISFFQAIQRVLSGKTTSAQQESEAAVAAVKQEALLLQNISVADFPKQYQKQLEDSMQLSSLLSGVIDELPNVLGIGGDKTYLVLFQNNMELRPGGGFIGSYGLLRLHNGAVKDFSIHDVYDADGQLKGHVEPPFAIRRYIPLVHLYLRDSNFDPDFVVNAKAAAFLLSQETGDKVDGVFAVNLNVLKTLLIGFGNVYVPSYNETVTADNFFTLLENHAEKNSFPGSTQKKDFLQAFAGALLTKLQSPKTLNADSMLEDGKNLILGKDILVAFSNPLAQAPFGVSNFSGTLTDMRTNRPQVVNDFLGVVEANLGVNKVNAFVTRSLAQQITVGAKGNAVERATLTLTNNSDGTWPGGVYRNYLRFVLPKNAVVNGITIDTIDQHMIPAITNSKIYEAKAFVAPKGLEVAKEEEGGKNVYGFLVTIPEKKTMQIAISYTLPHVFSLSNQKQTEDIMLWKQSGVDAYPYTLSLTIPDSMRFLDTPLGTTSMQAFTYQTQITGDQDMSISFTTK